MNPMELFNQVKEMIEKKDFEAANQKSYLETVPSLVKSSLEQAKKEIP